MKDTLSKYDHSLHVDGWSFDLLLDMSPTDGETAPKSGVYLPSIQISASVRPNQLNLQTIWPRPCSQVPFLMY